MLSEALGHIMLAAFIDEDRVRKSRGSNCGDLIHGRVEMECGCYSLANVAHGQTSY